MTSQPLPTARSARIDWSNLAFLASCHLMAAAAIGYMVFVHFAWLTIALGALWFLLSGLAITAGYHRLFAHHAYRASLALRAFCLFFGAAAVQNSAVKWSADHRRHHAYTDTDEDPYSIGRGFWWAHIGWVFYHDELESLDRVPDLKADRLARFQHDHYLAIVIASGVLLPAAIGSLWGDALGAFLVAGFLRLALQWHSTFCVNSLAHTIGSQPYSTEVSARDSVVTSLVTLGEGYHNFHHRFQSDYRNGVRWYHFDPTKWFVWSMSKIGVTSDLRRMPKQAIARAKARMRGQG